LFCSYEIQDASDPLLGVFEKLLTKRGVHGLGWFHDDWTCSAKVLEKLNDFFVAENFGGIGMCLWCSWKYLDEQDLMEFIG
jgi:hypothetical protein